ncbi:MAG TPA: winged helix-turn-helix domain-containing protein [Thermoanaerobaculia bacterium]|nr:winged helix-turn-helix domain-containing protein [Thermoanaerobaculia bacterium]
MLCDPHATPLDRSTFELAGVRVRPELNRLDRADGPHSVEPKVMDVLLCLAERPGEVLTREQILDRVWADTAVTDDVLTRSVGELRRLLGDDPKRPRVIETIRKRGYRLIAPLERLPADGGGNVRRYEGRARRARIRWLTLALAGAVSAGAALWALALRPGAADADRPRVEAAAAERDGLRLLPLAAADRRLRDPALSPDGTRIAYSRLDEDDRSAAIFVRTRTASGAEAAPLRITTGEHADRLPVFSPDGTEIAFVREPDGDCELWVAPVTGGRERRLASCAGTAAARFDWAPSGAALAISRPAVDGSGRHAIHLLDLSTGALLQLTRPRPPFRGDVEPRFSPDGARVAFGRVMGSTVTELWTVEVATARETRLTHDHRDTMGQAWSVDGDTIVFSSNRAGHYGLWEIPAGGGEPRWLTGGGSKIKHPAHARHAPLIAWEDWQLEINLWRVPLGGSEDRGPGEEPVARSTQWDFAPAISPDGARLAFLSSRGGGMGVWVRDLVSGEEFPVTRGDDHATAGPRWSPDGGALTWVAWRAGRSDVFVTAVDSYAPTQLTDDDAHEIAPAFSHDGSTVLFGSDRTSEWEVWRAPLDGGEATRVTSEGGLAAQELPDGTIYLLHPLRGGLWRRSPQGTLTAVAGAPRPDHWSDWQVGSSGIFVATRAGGGTRLYRVPYRGGAVEVVAELGETARPGIAIAPDERSVIVSRVDRAECDLLLAENLAGAR